MGPIVYFIGNTQKAKFKKINFKIMIENITNKFVSMFTPEPQRTFREAGIIDGENILTKEGRRIFLSWLLNEKFSAEFKADVVDPIIAAAKKNCKNS